MFRVPGSRAERRTRNTNPEPGTWNPELQGLIHLRPIHHVPPRSDVIGTTVLVLQVVGVLPDVASENRVLPFHQRIVLIRRAGDRQLAAVVDQPHPPAAEPAGSGFAPLLLERV